MLLKDVHYPDCFTNPETAVVGDTTINHLLDVLRENPEKYTPETGDTLVKIGEVSVQIFKLVAECEIQDYPGR